MSLDIVVWLSCSVSLPGALPQSEEWKHWRASTAQLATMPKELAAMLEGAESWDLTQSSYILRAAYASKEPLGWEELAKLNTGIQFNVIKAERTEVTAEQLQAEANTLRLYQEKIKIAKMGVSLVLEGVNERGIRMQENVATHLAKACGGAFLETPSGFRELDKDGKDKR
jgi:hypothetical protein